MEFFDSDDLETSSLLYCVHPDDVDASGALLLDVFGSPAALLARSNTPPSWLAAGYVVATSAPTSPTAGHTGHDGCRSSSALPNEQSLPRAALAQPSAVPCQEEPSSHSLSFASLKRLALGAGADSTNRFATLMRKLSSTKI
jgi:hypothetical protein